MASLIKRLMACLIGPDGLAHQASERMLIKRLMASLIKRLMASLIRCARTIVSD